MGLSARELQSLATVTERLEALPAIRTAFDAGEISWAQVRLLVGIATPESERAWLELARGRTVRALAAVIRAAGRSEVHEEEDRDDEPRGRFRLRCPRRVARLWQETVELARRMAGAELTQGQAAEVIAAEGLSARPPSAEVWPEPPPRPNGHRIRKRRRRRSPLTSTGRPSARRSPLTSRRWRSAAKSSTRSRS